MFTAYPDNSKWNLIHYRVWSVTPGRWIIDEYITESVLTKLSYPSARRYGSACVKYSNPMWFMRRLGIYASQEGAMQWLDEQHKKQTEQV